MRSVIRKPSPKSSISARTKGAATRAVKRAVNPTYGKKGTGAIHDPKRAVYNRVYERSSFGADDFSLDDSLPPSRPYTSSSSSRRRSHDTTVIVTNNNIGQMVHEHPEILEVLRRSYTTRMIFAVIFVFVGLLFVKGHLPIGIGCFVITGYLLYRASKYADAYNDAEAHWNGGR